jgi:hypothetical protein
MAEFQSGIMPAPLSADTDAYVERRRRLRWEAQRSLHNKKLEAKEPLDKYADVLSRPELYSDEDVAHARNEVGVTQMNLSAERTFAALETLQEVTQAKDTGDIQFDSGGIIVSGPDQNIKKYLITHFGESTGVRQKIHMDWFPEFDLSGGLELTGVQDIKELVSQLHLRYMHHIGLLKFLYMKRMHKRLRGNLDHEELAREISNDKDIRNLSFAAEGLYHIVNSTEAGVFRNSLEKTGPLLPLGDEYLLDPAQEDVTHHIKNRSIWTYSYMGTNGQPSTLVVQSTTSRCRMPYNKNTQNEDTTTFFNQVISPHTQKWVLITMRTPLIRYAIKIMPFHGLNTSMVFPFFAEEVAVTDADFRKRKFNVHSVIPYAIQGKATEIDAMYQAARVARFAGKGRTALDTSQATIEKHFKAIMRFRNDGQMYAEARVFYSKEDKHLGDTTIYFIYYSGYIFGVQIYAPPIVHLWKQYHKRLDYDHPDPWTTPPHPPNQKHPMYGRHHLPEGGQEEGREGPEEDAGAAPGAPAPAEGGAHEAPAPAEGGAQEAPAPPAPAPAGGGRPEDRAGPRGGSGGGPYRPPGGGGYGEGPYRPPYGGGRPQYDRREQGGYGAARPQYGRREPDGWAAGGPRARGGARGWRVKGNEPVPDFDFPEWPSFEPGHETFAWPLTPEYQRALKRYDPPELPETLVAEWIGPSGTWEELRFSLSNPLLMIYHNKYYDLNIVPYPSMENRGHYNWKMMKGEGKKETYLGRKDVKSKYLTTGDSERWQVEADVMGKKRAREIAEIRITPAGEAMERTEDLAPRRETREFSRPTQREQRDDDPYAGMFGGVPRDTNPWGTRGSDAWNESPYPLPLQPRRLAARPRPAPWSSPTSVDMAGVLASLAEIKRALNAQGMGLRL